MQRLVFLVSICSRRLLNVAGVSEIVAKVLERTTISIHSSESYYCFILCCLAYEACVAVLYL
jgi:hypothetical protein